MINTIDLSNYNYVFSDSELTDLKRKNFIYGKNGTGKTSLVMAIKDQYSEEYDIKIFDGWQGVIKESEYLDAIALGEKNADKQTEIDEIETEIKKINKKICEPEDKCDNLFKKQQEVNRLYKKQTTKIQKFLSDSGSQISKEYGYGRSYDYRNFHVDIPKAIKLSELEVKKLKETMNAEKILISEKISFPEIELKKFLDSTNEILQKVVLPSGVIAELEENIEKQNFAKLGMKIHNRELEEEHCSFCGSIISEKRWEELDEFFSDAVEKFDKQIFSEIEKIKKYIDKINSITKLDEKQFYPEYKDSLQNLNVEILELKSSYIEFFENLKDALEKKKGKTTIQVSELTETIPASFNDIQAKYNLLYEENKNYSDNFNKEKELAAKKKRLHDVKIALDEFNYLDEKNTLIRLQGEKDVLDIEIDKLKEKRKDMIKKQKELAASMTNESATVIKINQFLKGLGSHSFTLDHIESKDGERGQYRVLDVNGSERSVQTLSDGEKNIVAFLWFMDSLEETYEENEIEKDKIVIFDDPMNSNDDSCQYLMVSILQKFYREQNHPQMFLMTHNNHFYLQVTPNTKKYPNKGKNPEQKYIKFLKSEKKTSIIPILKDSDNLKTIYDELWEELKYAYESDKVIFMWNNMRRILETYNRFNFKNSSPADIEKEFDDVVDKVLIIALLKSLNVNSHVGYETDIDISGKTRDELKNIFSNIFERLHQKKHFDSYWPL